MAGTKWYNTVNGPKTLDQMLTELTTNGWPAGRHYAKGEWDRPKDEEIVATYASTTKAAVTPYTGTDWPTAAQPSVAEGIPQAQTRSPYANPYREFAVRDKIGNPDLLEEQPRLAFDWLAQLSNLPRQAQNYLGRNFDTYYNRYGASQAVDPSLKWTDYLAKLNLKDEYMKATPYERGETPSAFAPRLRFL